MDRNPSFQWDSVKVGKSGTCRSFERTGTCKFGKRCRYQHEATSAATAQEIPPEIASFFNNGLGDSTPRIHGKLREWKQLLSNGGTISRLSVAVVSRFFQLGLELMSGDVGSSQEVIKRLASDEGLPFVKVVVEKHLAVAIETGPGITFWTTELKPLFQLITHPRVIDSSVLEQEVVTVFNFILGVGGARMNRLFEYLVQLTTLWPDQTTDSTRMSAVELSLAVLSKILDCNTANIVNRNFATLANQFADIVATGPDELEKFASLQSAKYIDYIRRRLQVGYDIPEMSSLPRVSVLREEFVLHRDLPGTLSAEGPRHDNDFADMSKISILPTCEEIMSPRAEYLPTKDSSQWHIAGIRGRLDREFRLLREDTVGQLRDTVRDVLEHLSRPQEMHANVKNSLRTYMYEDPVLMKVDFSRNDGIELKVRCQQLPAVVKLTKTQREEWWQRSRRLQAGALVCVIDVSGLVQFFVVSRSTIRSQNETRFSSKKDKTASNPEKEDQQPACTLSDDANYLFVTLQLVDSEAEAVKEVLQWYGAVHTNRQRYLVEFPGVILDSFRHTLAALQQMYRKQDMPFSDILAPAAEAGAAVDIEPALYARKPMFKFDLGCLKDELMVSPANIPDPAELALVSSLDLTQAAAVLNTLSRKISLIQGPPGTGKSYTGEKIIQVLLGNKKAANLGPVLCVCYTNHALDQLLDHLLDAGVDGVIRIGSRSKSEKLVNLNLQSIVKRFEKTKSESAKLGKAEGGIKHVVQQVGDHLRRLEACGSWSALKEHLQEYYPQQYKSFEPVEEEDGWIQVMRRKPEERFTNWLQTGENTAVAPRAISILEQSDVWEMSRLEGGAVTDKEAVRAYGFALLERATEMSRLYPSTAIFADEIDAVASSLNGSFQALTEEEMRDVVEAMVGDVGSGGRWYVCENGHPFTIGECGRPMEEARCSECDARVGGRNHVMVNGVDVATDLNRIAREMEEMEL
ncbi:Zinc finger, CCCH-type [Metarhizium rileyi]|uniref:Zinc finger, CCCH-type n=1 Tax=Metarhizium rileyi (strain RCEF 4871) TaxID=1649241 RepID=A0A162J737_METRR|nr:Zinc finger, CCCH-type [Metarhizium rileyi RCEF 4871]